MKRNYSLGFTLIEVIVALVLLGLLAGLGLQGVESILRGYILGRENAAVAQKAQIALNRMTIELNFLDTTQAVSGSANSLTYWADYNNDGVADEQHTISLSGNQVTFAHGGTAYVLTDDVNSANGLVFSYFSSYNGAAQATYSASTPLVGIALTMHGSDWDAGVTRSFVTRVLVGK